MRFESHQEKRYARMRKQGVRLPEVARPQGFQPPRKITLYSPAAPLAAASSTAVTPPPLAVIVLNRAAFGPRPGDIEAFNALGATDDARLTTWVDRQLDPDSIDDSALEARLNIPAYQTLDKSLTQLWNDHHLSSDWVTRIRPVKESAYAKYVRATYSERQLVEVLADFWHDHFNVYGYDDPANSLWVEYDQRVIRAHLLGNFRAMLEAVTKSTAMLDYLDNFVSSAESPNENFARELMELHTLGAGNYFGAIDPAAVPKDANGVAVGFVEADVKAVARCLTGWSYNTAWDSPPGHGEFLYRDYWHDDGAKQVLGVAIPAGQPALKDGRDVLDLLAAHPGTARFVCEKLCRRLVADEPPASLVESAAALFTAAWQAPDQLRQVVRHILLSSEFRSTWGEKIKRPFETAVSAMRALRFDFTLVVDDSGSNEGTDWTYSEQLEWLFEAAGHAPFTWGPPNGFPDKRAVWSGTSALVAGWRLVNHLLEGDYYGRNDSHPTGIHAPVLEDTLAAFPDPAQRTPNNLAAFWLERILGYAPSQQLVSRIAAILDHSETSDQHQDPDQPINLDNNDWPTYWRAGLRAMVGMILMSPEFLHR